MQNEIVVLKTLWLLGRKGQCSLGGDTKISQALQLSQFAVLKNFLGHSTKKTL